MNPQHRRLLTYGVASSIFYVFTDLMGSSSYPGYSILDQSAGELLATGAPTRSVMLLVGIVYNIIVGCFAFGVWLAATPRRTARVTGGMMLGYTLMSFITPLFFPMDMRGGEITASGALHPAMMAVMSLFILLSIGFGGFLLGRWFRWYSLTTIVVLLIFGFFTVLQLSKIGSGQPTPWMGLTARICIYATMVWIGVLSVLLVKKRESGSVTRTLARDARETP